MDQQNSNPPGSKKILADKDREIDELKAKFDSGESEGVLRSENEELFKELEWINTKHKDELKAMETSSELAMNKQLQEITSLKTALEKAQKLAEEHAADAEARRE
jgi:hypothetical protein